jgi:hypothetical protein
MQSLALDRATSETKALKLFPAMSAVDMKAALASPHWSAILPLISYLGLQPILNVTRIAFDVILRAAVRAKATATVDHAIAAHKAFGDVSALGAFTAMVGKNSFRNAFGLHKNFLKNKLRKRPRRRSPEPGASWRVPVRRRARKFSASPPGERFSDR